jgi:uncharacterized protein (DUF1501 family)
MHRGQDRTYRLCNGVTRRDLLKVGALSTLGLALPDLLRLQAAQAARTGTPARDVNCILIFQAGGSSQLETFDMKPDAPAEVRGEFKPIDTNVPGVRICEHLPRLARQMDRFSIIRSLTHTNAGHGGGAHYMCTGKHPVAGFVEGVSRPNNQHPFFGAVVAQQKGIRRALPPYISLPMLLTYGGPAFLGPAYMPFVIESDPSSPSFRVRDLNAAPGVDAGRQEERRKLRALFNDAPHGPNPRIAAMDTFYQKAYDLVTSDAAHAAFDIAREPGKVRDDYGRNPFGQSALMARRLIEAGCRFVSIDHGGWDNHTTIFQTLKSDLLPQVDSGLGALLADLKQRGLLESTLVVMFGEFGRTVRVNKDAGRDHWPNAASVFMAGGGTKPGVVVGKTDANGEYPAERPVSPEDLAATIYTCLGVDYHAALQTPLGRPVQVVTDGEPVRELIG